LLLKKLITTFALSISGIVLSFEANISCNESPQNWLKEPKVQRYADLPDKAKKINYLSLDYKIHRPFQFSFNQLLCYCIYLSQNSQPFFE
jgi:hypothetical protein